MCLLKIYDFTHEITSRPEAFGNLHPAAQIEICRWTVIQSVRKAVSEQQTEDSTGHEEENYKDRTNDRKNGRTMTGQGQDKKGRRQKREEIKNRKRAGQGQDRTKT